MGHERPVAELIREAFRRSGLVRGVRRAEAVVLWRRVVGEDVARFSSAVALQHGTLVVDVPDPETAMHLGLQRHHLLRAYAEHLGPDVVREIRFRVGRPAEADAGVGHGRGADPSRAGEPAPTAEPRALAAMVRALQEVPEELAGPALQAGAALLNLRARRRAAGWVPCEVCGALREPGQPEHPQVPLATRRGWCSSCRRHASQPRVARQAERLVSDPDAPTPTLSEDELLVARKLAAERAADMALALLPQALADPRWRDDLERLAQAQAALQAGVPLSAVDERALAHVDARVLRALGRFSLTRTHPKEESDR